jgi:hypothetical protein
MAGAAQAELREGGGGPESPQREPEGFRPEFGQEVRDAQDSGSRGLEEPDGCAEEEDCPLEARGIGIAWEPSQISVSAAIRLEEREREREYRKKLKKKKKKKDAVLCPACIFILENYRNRGRREHNWKYIYIFKKELFR